MVGMYVLSNHSKTENVKRFHHITIYGDDYELMLEQLKRWIFFCLKSETLNTVPADDWKEHL